MQAVAKEFKKYSKLCTKRHRLYKQWNAISRWKPQAQDHSNKMLMLHRFIIMFSVLIADAGKSTTGGQILFLSGQVDDRTIQKYEKEAKDKSRESW